MDIQIKKTVQQYTYEALDYSCRQLAMKIRRSNDTFDCILAITGGGLFVAHALSQYLDISRVWTVGIKYPPSSSKERVFTNVPNPILLRGSNVLIVDIISETGETLRLVRDFLMRGGDKESIQKTCVLFSIIAQPVVLLPHFYNEQSDEEITFIFPWTKR